ncbi:MAG: 6-phosphogluconolactonase [Thermoanaerobaculia bacterium]|nr:6-phosphogluconolactonase [Thermoanaerobaculia bacterium]
MARTQVTVFPSAVALADGVADLFAARAAEAVEERGRFRVALAGGTTPLAAYRRLAASPWADVVPWGSVEVFFGDERCVGECDGDRNDAAAREALLLHVPVPPENVHPVPSLAPDAAERYEALLRERLGAPAPAVPVLDLVLLGLGEDGHTASLFPGHPAAAETRRLVVRVDGAPKPPPSRVSFTLPLLNAARTVVFVVSGDGKRGALARVLSGDRGLPAACVDPPLGERLFYLDRAAAGED